MPLYTPSPVTKRTINTLVAESSWSPRGTWLQIGSSTTANSVTAVGSNGQYVSSRMAMWNYASHLSKLNFDIEYAGYAGQMNSYIFPLILPKYYSGSYSGIILQASANDLTTDTSSYIQASADTKAKILELLGLGIPVIVHGPHPRKGTGTTYKSVCAYDIVMQEFCDSVNIPYVSGVYAITNGLDKVCSLKTGVMDTGEDVHLNSWGAQTYAVEAASVLTGGYRFRIPPAGNADNALEIYTNPRMTGSAGSVGAGVTGVVPDNWTVVRGAGTGSAVASVGTDSEGSYMDLTITAVDGDYYYVNPDSAATISTRLAAGPADASYRQYANVEIVSGSGIKRIQTQINFGATILQTPDGSGSTWAAQAQLTGRRMMRTKAISVAKMGTSVSANGGLLIGIVGTSTSVVRIRGVSLRSAGV